MEKIVASGRILFAICIVALGAENLVCARFKEAVLPVLPWLPPYPVLAYITGIFLTGVGLAIAAGIRVRMAAILLAIFLLVCEVLLQVPRAAAAPLDLSIRTTVFEVLSLCGAALTLAVSFPDPQNFQRRSTILDRFLSSGRYLFAVSSVVFGIAHFLIAPFIATLIPAWIPARLFWAYFTGGAFVAAGVSIAVGWLDALAAMLLGTMFLLWFLLLHTPRVLSAARSHNPNEWSSAFIALGMCGASWIIASDSLRRRH
jgi:uncharacterized membrane protein YphA (DoxX/SURF4 family)